jgi:anti-sigma regulatory factor (Ser/Thr protein kinase)/putative methionine-R-sulfoxide reductase with GAF domain
VKSRIAADRLRDIETITDAALAHLPLERLLDELLVRVVAILGVDTSAILLLEDDETTLVPRAAKGLEEEVERGIRIPLGRGFAGRIAATREPVRILNVADADIVNPILREKGLHSLLGVPLLVEGNVIGVLHVGALQERAFDDEDVDLLQRAGDRAALAIYSRLTERERGLADALQRSLMPRLPELPGVSLAGRYLPAASARLGGDWYDAFPLPDGRLALAIGDVVGHGFHAAAIMGQLRSGLRAYALDGMSPSAVLERLSRLLRQLEPGRTATLVYLVLDPHGGSLIVAGAGHPPPLVATIRGAPSFLELPGSVPLAAARHVRYDQLELVLEPGAALVLYTDGLVERTGESLDAGLERLAATVRAGDDDLEHLGDELVDIMLPEGTGGDDAALLLARAMPLEDTLVARFPAEIESIPVMRRLLARWLDEAGATRADVDDLSLACAEAAANAIEHAYGLAPGIVEIRAWTSNRRVKIAIRDFGNWRAPRGRHRGRGLLLMEGLADEVEVSRSDEGTTIELSRQLGAAAA